MYNNAITIEMRSGEHPAQTMEGLARLFRIDIVYLVKSKMNECITEKTYSYGNKQAN